jgi:hypothetical protein
LEKLRRRGCGGSRVFPSIFSLSVRPKCPRTFSHQDGRYFSNALVGNDKTQSKWSDQIRKFEIKEKQNGIFVEVG